MSNASRASKKNRWAQGIAVVAATFALIAGIFQIIQGLAGVLADEIFVSLPNYTFEFDTTVWGWIHAVIGIVFVLVAYLLFTGSDWGRPAGIGIAMVSAIANFMWLPYYPLWAIVLIVIDVIVMWALATAKPLDY